MDLDPDKLSISERYKLLIGCIVPRPIAVVSTIDHDGTTNLAPFSFFNGVGSNPMTLLFCPSNAPDGSEKDTLHNCKPAAEGGRGEFVINVATEDYAARVAACAEAVPPEVSEFDLSGLNEAPSTIVAPPRVAESPVSFECRTMQVIRTNPGEAGGGNVVIGRVVHVHLRDDIVDARLRTDAKALAAIGRMGGMSYCFTRDRFDLPVGVSALDIQPDGKAPSPRG